MSTVLDNATFRANFPEFADMTRYPDSLITYWGTVAGYRVNERIWRGATLNGMYLYVAHELTLAQMNEKTEGVGGNPGSQSGPMNSKTVGSVTASYDTQQTAEEGAGWWNLTTYGKQFYRLMKLFGAGAIQLGGGIGGYPSYVGFP